MYATEYAPRYAIAFGVDCATAVLAILAATVLRFVLVRANRKLDVEEHEVEAQKGGVASGLGTSKKFRYLV